MTSPSDARVVVTGANGFVGSHTVRELEARGVRVVATDIGERSADLALLPVVTPTQLLDIQDRASLVALCREARATQVIHLAFPTRNQTGDTLDVLFAGIRNTFEAAKTCGAARVVFASSAAEYGRLRKPGGTVIREDDAIPIFPNFLYRSTLVGEWLGAYYARQYGIGFVALRLSYPPKPRHFTIEKT